MKTRHTAIIFLAVLSIVTFGCDGDDCDGEEIMLPDGQVICIDTFSTNLAKKQSQEICFITTNLV